MVEDHGFYSVGNKYMTLEMGMENKLKALLKGLS